MFSLFKKFISIFIVLAIFGWIGFSPSHSTEKNPYETLTIGLQSGYPPFEFLDSNGKVQGFDVDVAQAIANKMGKELIVKDMDFEAEILSLKQGKIDLIVSGMNITPTRKKEITMIPYHGEAPTHLTLMFWKQIPEGIHTLEDVLKVPDAIVSVQSGALTEVYMSHFPHIKTKSFQGALDPLMDVKFGKSLANLVEPDVATYLKSQHPEIKTIDIPLSEADEILGFGIGVKKENQKLAEQVQLIILELKSSGALKQLENKWFKGDS